MAAQAAAADGSFANVVVQDRRSCVEARGLGDDVAEADKSDGRRLWDLVYAPFPTNLGKKASRREREEQGFVAASLTRRGRAGSRGG